MDLQRTKEELNKFGKYVVQQARTNLTKKGHKSSGQLYRSITFFEDDYAKGSKIAFGMEPYGWYLDKGVKGSKSYYADQGTAASRFSFKSSSKIPPIDSIAEWAKTKRIRLRDDKGKFQKGNYKSIGFIIARSIKEKGIAATLFFTKPFNRAFDRLPPDLSEALLKDLFKI